MIKRVVCLICLLAATPAFGWRETYNHEIEVGTTLITASFNEVNSINIQLPVVYRYRVLQTFSAGMSLNLGVLHASNEVSETALMFLPGPSIRMKFAEGSAPFLEMGAGLGLAHFSISDGEEWSDTFFTMDIGSTIGYIYNVRNVDLSFGLSYGFLYIDTPRESTKTHSLGVGIGITFLR